MFFQKKKYLNFSPFFYFTLFSSEFFPKLLIVLKNSNDIYFDRKRGIVSFTAKRCQGRKEQRLYGVKCRERMDFVDIEE